MPWTNITRDELKEAADAVNTLAKMASFTEDLGTVNLTVQPLRELFAKIDEQIP